MRTPTDDSERKVVSDVQEFGWHVMLVAGDEAGPEFAFTIGLFHSYGHPEIIVFGLPFKVAHAVLNQVGTAVKSGGRFQTGDRSRDFLERHECAFVGFPATSYHDFLGYARWFYSGDNFPTLQFVWPDAAGAFPWDASASPESRLLQPIAGPVGKGGVI